MANDILLKIPISEVIYDKNICNCLRSLGYAKISQIQRKVFKLITDGFSVIIVAPTGSGKTEAAILPILFNIRRKHLKPIAAIYVTPLRALNRDIEARIRSIASCFGLAVGLRHGDTPSSIRRSIRENPPHILVTTPESFNYLLVDDKLRSYMLNTRFIVIDEFRELVTSKRGIELLSAISILESIAKRRILKVALTATLANEYSVIKLLDNPSYIQIIRSQAIKKLNIFIETPSLRIKGFTNNSIDVDPEFYARLLRLKELIEKYKYVLIFVNTRDLAERLGWAFSSLLGMQNKVLVHHGSLSKHHRLRAEKLFKRREVSALIATSSLELGIDIGHIEYVIQYMSPRQTVRLIQRIGRSIHRVTGIPRGSIITLGNFFDALESIIIAYRSLMGCLEDEDIPNKPLDVLAHQIVLRVLIKPGIRYHDLYLEFTRNRVFRDISMEIFGSVVEYLTLSKILRVRDGRVYPGYRAKKYFYRTTMIPDTRNILVLDISTGKKIGVVNEEFVILHIEEGSSIVLGGGIWRVIGFDSDEGKLYVEPIEESETIIIPRWEGESIPVEHKVARHAGAFVKLLGLGKNPWAFFSYSEGLLNISSDVKNIIEEIVDNASEVPLPSDRDIVVEVNRNMNYMVLYGFYGSKVSNTLKAILVTFARRIWPYIQSYSSPYYIILYFDKYRPTLRDVTKIIDELKKIGKSRKLFNKFLETIIKESNTFLWRVFYVAQRFGAIDPKGKRKITRSMLKALSQTIIGYEAYRETLLRDFDLENTYKLLRDIGHRIKVHLIDSTDKHYILFKHAVNRIPTAHTMAPIVDLDTYKERLMRKSITLICLICGYKWGDKVRNIISTKYITCPRCKSRYVAIVKGDGMKEYEIVKKVLAKNKLTSEERKIYRELQKKALLTMDFGSKAALLLASRGVGYAEAVRIINLESRGKDLFKLLYEAEKKYIRIKKYLK